jgi:hypothetical protein
MSAAKDEAEQKKRAIFDGMSERGRQRVLRLGYDNWDPFQEPKDPREQIRGSLAVKVNELLNQFYAATPSNEEAKAFHRELTELCRGLLQEELRAQKIYQFCLWYWSFSNSQGRT